MDSEQFYRTRLPDHLDSNGDLAPPWEQFPTYERYTIGWRMGSGEGWMCMWHVFLEDMAAEYEVRLAYLRRHPPAPVTWADSVYRVLYPQSGKPDPKVGDEAERRAGLRRDGLIASDVAYATWLSQQEGVRWPWEHADTPEDAARYRTREFWFWSRQVAALRSGPPWVPPDMPDEWRACAAPLETGSVPALDLRLGLLSLAQMLLAGQVVPPWQLGLSPGDFADTFDDDMGFVDAFRLWGMAAFDDREQLQRYLAPTGVPAEWEGWIAERFQVD